MPTVLATVIAATVRSVARRRMRAPESDGSPTNSRSRRLGRRLTGLSMSSGRHMPRVTSRHGLLRPLRPVRQLHAHPLPRCLAHAAAHGRLGRGHGAAGRRDRDGARGRSRTRSGRPAGHARAGRRRGRLAGALREGLGRGHPGGRHADLARGEVEHVHAPDRAALRQLRPAQRQGPVGLLRPRRRLHRDRQRGRGQALRDERPVLAAAPRLRDPAAGRLVLARRGGPRAELRRRGHRPGERVHPEEHGLRRVEPHAPRRAAQAGGWPSERGQRPERVGGRRELRPSEPGSTAARRPAARAGRACR